MTNDRQTDKRCTENLNCEWHVRFHSPTCPDICSASKWCEWHQILFYNALRLFKESWYFNIDEELSTRKLILALNLCSIYLKPRFSTVYNGVWSSQMNLATASFNSAASFELAEYFRSSVSAVLNLLARLVVTFLTAVLTMTVHANTNNA